jgi:hypothetical protein
MPYATKKAKIAYYKRHKKFYDAGYILAHKKEWNKYQREYRVLQRNKVVENIKNIARDLNISDKEDLSFIAVVIFLFIITGNHSNEKHIHKRLGYNYSDTKTIFSNWRSGGVYKNGVFELESPELEIVEITLIGLLGAGEVCRKKI